MIHVDLGLGEVVDMSTKSTEVGEQWAAAGLDRPSRLPPNWINRYVSFLKQFVCWKVLCICFFE